MIVKRLNSDSGLVAQIFIDEMEGSDEEALASAAAEVSVLWIKDPNSGKDAARVTWRLLPNPEYVTPQRARSYAGAIAKAADIAEEIECNSGSREESPQLGSWGIVPPSTSQVEEPEEDVSEEDWIDDDDDDWSAWVDDDDDDGWNAYRRAVWDDYLYYQNDGDSPDVPPPDDW